MKQWEKMAALLLAGFVLAGCGEKGRTVPKQGEKGKKPKILIVCSTEWDGGPVLEAAKHIRDRTKGDLLHIRSDGDDLSSGLPGVMPPLCMLDGYDAYFFGGPAWSLSAGPSLEMFLASCNTDGKTVFPFLTDDAGNAASYLKRIRKDVSPKSKTAPALIVRKSSAQDVFPGRAPHHRKGDMKARVDEWLDRMEADGWL